MKSKILLFCLLPIAGFAQIVVTDNAVVSIQPATIFYAGSDFTNNGTVMNNGSLILSGAWTNAGTYLAEGGQVTFDGAGQQIINHNAQTFTKLLIDGGGEKIFKADITIGEELNLQGGILTSQNNSKIILSQQAVITGGSDNSYIQGALYQTGTGSKFYPVGTGTQYLPVTMTDITGTNPVVGIEAVASNLNSKIDISLTSVSSNRYWDVRLLSGTFDGSPASLPLTDEDSSRPLVVAEATDANEPFKSLGGNIQGESITSKDQARVGQLAVAEAGSTAILVYNAVTPGNNDNKHDFLKIVNIEHFPDNEVTIVNRWGDKVFQMTGYNNADRIFNGEGNTNGIKELSDGTYYYVVDKKNGDPKISGFFVIRR